MNIFSIIRKVLEDNKVESVKNLTFDDLVAMMKGLDSETEKAMEFAFRGARIRNKKLTPRAWLKKEFEAYQRKHKDEGTRRITLNDPKQFAEVVNMLKEIREHLSKKDLFFLKDTIEKINQKQPISSGELSNITSMWEKAKSVAKKKEEMKGKGILEMLGTIRKVRELIKTAQRCVG